MAVLTHTFVKTYALYSPWAETLPWDCLIRATSCCSPDHDHKPMVGDICAEPQCHEALLDKEACYSVTELPRKNGREQWVCWRHVRPDEGPVRI